MEHISLNNSSHENDKYSYDQVTLWLNKLFDINFSGREILVKQLENSKYKLINGEGFISIKLSISSEKENFPFKDRIPVEMIAFQQDRYPIMFLLHILHGIVDELEIYTADGSSIDREISVLNIDHKVAGNLK